MNYPSMKIVIANSICSVAVSRFPHRQASVVAKKKKAIFGDENRAQMSTYGRPPCTVNNLDHVSRHTYRNNIYIPNPPIALTPIPLRHCTCVKRLLAVSQPQVWISYSQESSDSVRVKTDPLTGHFSTKI